MHKICKKIDFKSKEWRDYVLWRKYNFTTFESLDSSTRQSIFCPNEDADWNHVLQMGSMLTDVVTDHDYAVRYCLAHGADEVLNFDFVENEDGEKTIIGYDILDGDLDYSLLTNFGNDIKIVNGCLAKNGLIRHKKQAIEVHEWFLANMAMDGHVEGSKVLAVYEKTVIGKHG